jgi:spore maturation protein CgeB
MNISLFYHSLVSDWNHGNAHFLRGIVSELLHQGHHVKVYEPRHNWSLRNLVENHGTEPLARFRKAYPGLESISHEPGKLDLESELSGTDLVIVHEWNHHELVRKIGELKKRQRFVLLFHDTHHRLVTNPAEIRDYDLTRYDGVLAFGNVLRDLYLSQRLTPRAWTWHEAADIQRFHPMPDIPKEADLVWIGNWGDEERTAELHEFLIKPVSDLGITATVYGVRYPEQARRALQEAGIQYKGWLPNFDVPQVFARHRLTVHVPRRPYMEALPGIPTIRPFEALACGIPLVSAPWRDTERLFQPGRDYLVARDGHEMKTHLQRLLADGGSRESLAQHGLRTLRSRHTCAHRVRELMEIHREITHSRRQNLKSTTAPA